MTRDKIVEQSLHQFMAVWAMATSTLNHQNNDWPSEPKHYLHDMYNTTIPPSTRFILS